MRFRTALGFLVIVLAAPAAVADETSGPLSTLASGDRVRVQIAGSGKSLRASIESVTAGELLLRPVGGAQPLRLDLAQLQSVDVARGQGSRWRKGAVIGFVPGTLLFGLLGGVLGCMDVPDCSFHAGYAVGTGLVGGAATASVGALVGLAFKTDRWVRVHERKPKVALMLAPMRVGLSLNF